MSDSPEQTSPYFSHDNRRNFLRRSARGWLAASLGFVAGHTPTPVRGADRPQDAASPTGFADVRAFGAAGDGTTDDTDAFREAVASGEGGVWIPRGRYRLTDTVAVDLTRHGPMSVQGDGTATILMEGAGPAFHLLGSHDGTANPRTVDDQVWAQERMPLVDGLEILGAHEEAIGLRIEGTMQAVVTRCSVREARHGIHLFRRNRNVIVSNCHLYENRGVGLFLDRLNLHQVNVTGCHVSYNGGGGIVARGSEIRNLQVGSCDLEGNMASDQPSTGNILLDTREGRVREGAIVGCTIQHTREGPESANIRMIGQSTNPPMSAGRFAIADNAMSDADYNIHLVNARGITIVGNIFWVAQHHTLLAENCMHLVLSTNTLEKNPDYSTDVHRNFVFRGCSDSSITNTHVQGSRETEAGIVLDDCDSFNVTGCQILDCENAGVLLRETSYSRVSDCIIRGPASEDFRAVRVNGGTGNMIANNLLQGDLEIDDASATLSDNLQPE